MHRRVDLLRVLHDPVQYYRPWRPAAAQLLPGQRGALNAWLARQHALPAYSPPSAAQAVTVQRLVQGWARLPQTAYLMACALHWKALLASPALLGLPAPAQAMLRLRFASPGPNGVDVACRQSLQSWGAAYLLHGLHPCVPDWLIARARLCFEGLPLPPQPAADSAGPFDVACFWSAWNHAENLP